MGQQGHLSGGLDGAGDLPLLHGHAGHPAAADLAAVRESFRSRPVSLWSM
jgi:hypothetical protein